MNKCLLVVVILSANLLLTSCADDQARTQLAETNARLSVLEQNVSLLGNKVSNQKVLDLLNKLDEQQSQINQLNGDVSTLKQNQQSYQATQEQVNRGLQSQLQQNASEAISAQKTTDVDDTDTLSKSQSRDRSQLNIALKRLKARDFNNAIRQFKTIIATSKDAQIVAGANYYLAVSYVANKQYKNAITVSKKFVTENPNSANASDALRIMYISQTQLGMNQDATNTADTLIKTYPNSDAAKKLK